MSEFYKELRVDNADMDQKNSEPSEPPAPDGTLDDGGQE